jgi:hypothetical protein
MFFSRQFPRRKDKWRRDGIRRKRQEFRSHTRSRDKIQEILGFVRMGIGEFVSVVMIQDMVGQRIVFGNQKRLVLEFPRQLPPAVLGPMPIPSVDFGSSRRPPKLQTSRRHAGHRPSNQERRHRLRTSGFMTFRESPEGRADNSRHLGHTEEQSEAGTPTAGKLPLECQPGRQRESESHFHLRDETKRADPRCFL